MVTWNCTGIGNSSFKKCSRILNPNWKRLKSQRFLRWICSLHPSFSHTVTALSVQTQQPTCQGGGAGLARLWAYRHTSAAQRLGLCEDQTATEGNRAFGEEQRLKPFKCRREIRATQKPRGIGRPRRNRQVPPACQMFTKVYGRGMASFLCWVVFDTPQLR